MTDNTAWIALSLVERVGGKTLNALMRHFNFDPHAILAADVDALQQVPGIGPKIAHSIQAIRLEQIEQALPRWRQAGVNPITFHGRTYPARLRPLPDAPPTLFTRGIWPPLTERTVAIVGTRQPSKAAAASASALACELAGRAWTVISGLATGIDTAAHIGALAAPQGYTLAVLGSGVLNIYPPENRALALAVVNRGALVSELHPGAKPSPAHLVARNRIITGLSDAVVVVETETDGGAMHAARFAAAQGRPLYTFDFSASGNHQLIAAGAAVIRADLRDLPF